jgi:Immunity protein 50
MKPYQVIDGHEQVIAVFGQWPSFHDGEVHRIVLDRMTRTFSGSFNSTLELHVRCWTTNPILTGDFQLQLEHDSVVRFLFEDLFDLEIEGFGQQNVLSSLNFSTVEDPNSLQQYLHVELEHCYVFSGEFNARRSRILGINPYVKPTTT